MFDILEFATGAKVSIGIDGSEHWLMGHRSWLLRLDVVNGTLLGGPVLLHFRLHGLARLGPKLETLAALVRLSADRGSERTKRAIRRNARWISELRTADAIQQGASHREIARVLFGDKALAGWRIGSDAYRCRVQRLVRAARARASRPVSSEWFRD